MVHPEVGSVVRHSRLMAVYDGAAMQVVDLLRQRLAHDSVSIGPTGCGFRAAPPASEVAVAIEARLGFRIPRTLREIYTTVANGGFGPGYGVMGVEGGFTDDLGHDVADLVETYRRGDPEDPTWMWPSSFLPICHWGCIVYSVVDCSREPCPIHFMDVSAELPGTPMSTIIEISRPSIEDWLGAWLAGGDLWSEYQRRSSPPERPGP